MTDADYLSFTNPATGEIFGQVGISTADAAQQAVSEMRAAFQVWSQRPVKERVRVLRRFQELLVDAADEITAVITQDTGKSRQDALNELFMTLDLLQQYCKHAPRWLRRRDVSSGLFFFKRCYVEPRPRGVVLVIAPWNYPLYLTLPPVLTALLAGNTVVIKPSEVTAATGVLIDDLFRRLPELAPFVRVLHGDGQAGAAAVAAAPDYIFLTGSTQTGRNVMRAAAEHLIPVSCELGGKDAVIVLEDADIAAAARWSAWGAFYNCGQTCMAVERVYVLEAVYDEFVRQAVTCTRELAVGYTLDCDNPYHVGPMTDPRQVRVVERHLNDALAKGARIVHQGRRDGMYIEPIVMVDVNHDMLLMRDETFGPILPIMKVKDEADAIRLANDSLFGLSASVWSNDLKRAERVAHQLTAGSIVINDAIVHVAIPMLPFGGVKHSGTGRIHGYEGLMQFTLPYSYVVSATPNRLDLTVIMRQPGRYEFGKRLLHLLMGVSWKQRIQINHRDRGDENLSAD